MRIVVGLGNPGIRYSRTRHNAGFMVVDGLAVRWGVALKIEPPGLLAVGRGAVKGSDVMLVKPQRYMNASGDALMQLPAPWYATDLIVVHDDIDLPVGRLRACHDGGLGGHLGLDSIDSVCGRDFDRVRVGVGRPPQGQDPAEYVLEELTEVEIMPLRESVHRAALAVECLLTDGLVEAMNRFNVRRPEPRQEFHREEEPKQT